MEFNFTVSMLDMRDGVYPNMPEQAYVAVFDGHGGKEAAKFVILIAFLSNSDIQKSSHNESVASPSSPSPSCSNDVETHDSTRPVHSPTPVIEPLISTNGNSLLVDNTILLPDLKTNLGLVNNKRTTVLTEMEMKKRKHKKHRKHGLERELARYSNIHTHYLSITFTQPHTS